ncbi:hypothetical protein BSKO_07624 [Bryopsis sp. KO-2023]|nr:hypothetical protein BSKO_07624 [Bryopsis sp. KO-2023]
MIYLTESETGFRVWDGVYERYLDKESRAIWKTRPAKPPARSPLTDVPFEALAFQQYIALEKRWEESKSSNGWLQFILELAREIDVLTEALLDRVDRSLHEDDFRRVPVEDSHWYRQNAVIDTEKGRARGQLLSCIWGGNEHELLLFRGQKVGRGPAPKQAWFSVRLGDTTVNLMENGCLGVPTDSSDVWINLTWDEAILECAKWMQQEGSLLGQCDAWLVVMLLDHRRKRFGMALHLARSGGSRNDFESAGTDRSKNGGLERDLSIAEARIAQLEKELTNVKTQSPLEGGVANAETKIDMLEKKLVSRDNKVEELTKTLLAADAQYLRLNLEKDLLLERMEDLQLNEAMLTEEVESLKKELGEARSLGGLDKTAALLAECITLRAELLQFQNGSSELKRLQIKVIELEGLLETSRDRIKLKERECDSLVAQQQNASCNTNAESPNGWEIQCRRLPSASESLQECQAVRRKVMELYFAHFRGSIAGKIRFGTCIATICSGMYNIVREGYDEYVCGLAEVLVCTQEAAKLVMDFHCRENWTRLFMHESPCGLDNTGKKRLKKEVDWKKKDVYDPFDLGSEDDDGTSQSDEGESEVGQELLDGQCRSRIAIQVEALQESAIEQLRAMVSSNELEVEKLKECFDKLWRTTVILFLQDPKYRFCGNTSSVGLFNREKHVSDLEIIPGGKVVILTPPLMRAAHPASSAGCGSTSHPEDWDLQEKAAVDSLH